MTAFWLYAGLLFAAALAFILVPQLQLTRSRAGTNRLGMNVALYRERLRELEIQHDAGTLDAGQLAAGRVEAARDLLDDAQRADPAAGVSRSRAIPVLAALATPLLGCALYLHWGSLDQLLQPRQQTGQVAQSIGNITTRLEGLLAASPDSAEGWSLLGRAYTVQGRMGEAAHAFERAATLAGRPPELLGRWAEAWYYAGGRQWTPQLQALTDEALAANPHEATALRLAGMAAFQSGRYPEAASYWERLAATLPEGDPSRAAVDVDIGRARALESQPPQGTSGAVAQPSGIDR
ncbi:c-type cytochrome biogenesis protein CcmI [Bordetella sp. H567]|uniref:c-type cytochrome biogenesis protein CcmI n=1 Tax=Bordetella sp. H567 TaxID=1697043 RepID=UPI00082AED3E|nr:c-type cytochrome biogenesis protein CcmI [Bordetella sp. H567]